MKTIALTQGKEVVVDDEDFGWLSVYRWHAHKIERKNRVIWYAVGSARQFGETGGVLMHRKILAVTDRKVQVDHTDGDGLNNQKFNLRLAVRGQNQQNSRKQVGCTSRFKGVYWSNRAKKWQAQIMVQRKWINLGQYTCELEAAKAYNAAAKNYFGDFALLNDVDS